MFFLKSLPTPEMIETVSADCPEIDAAAIQTVLYRLRAASVLIREIDAYLRQAGLSQTQFLAMMMILREPGRDNLLASEIAERLDVSKPVLSKALANLREKGMITAAEMQPTDQRQCLLQLTEAGRVRFNALLPGYFRLLQDAAL